MVEPSPDLVTEALKAWGPFGGIVTALLSVIGILWRRDVAKDKDREELHKSRMADAEARFQEVKALANAGSTALERVSISLATFSVAQEMGNDLAEKTATLIDARTQVFAALVTEVAVLRAELAAVEKAVNSALARPVR